MADDIAHEPHHNGNSQGLEFTLSICLCYTLCILCLRLYIRWRAFSIDDLVVWTSAILAFVFFGCSYALKTAGLGEPVEAFVASQRENDRMNALSLASNLSWIGALCLSKLAIVSMLLRTSVATAHRAFQYLVGALVAVQCIVTIIVLTAGCTKLDGFAWDFRLNDGTCPRQTLRWRIVTGFDISTELTILALPFHLVWNLQMPMKSKAVVVAAFWLRLPVLIFTSLRNHATNNLSYTSDVSLTAGMVVIWQSLELSCSLAAATIAALKRFTESLNTGFGHGELLRVHGQIQSYKLSDRSASIKDSKTCKPPVRIDTNGTDDNGLQKQPEAEEYFRKLKLRPDDTYNQTNVSSLPKESGNMLDVAHDACLHENIIRHDVQYFIHYDEEPLVPAENHR